jgi:transposase-like protein
MNQETIIADIEQRARAVPISIGALCQRAGLHPTTFSRWKRSANNPEPRGATLLAVGRLYDALEAIEAKRSAPRLSGTAKMTGRSATA